MHKTPKPILTTITPVWNRPEMFNKWIVAMQGAHHPNINHIVYFVGEKAPCEAPPNFTFVECPEAPGLSIAHYHNRGAQEAQTGWIMKLDVDVLPHVCFFDELLKPISMALARQWFNVGMFYANKSITHSLLADKRMPLTVRSFQDFSNNIKAFTNSGYQKPAASNFVCRRMEYLELGGCHQGFRGYGWEDYYQIYILEHHYRGKDPLPGPITLETAPRRVRDEIARPAAANIWNFNPKLALIHCWHPGSAGTAYKSKAVMDSNRRILFDFINKKKGQPARKKR